MSEILFEIKEENLETGLRGYPVGYCTTSSVDPVKGLFYVGRPVVELVNHTPEQVIYLLLNGQEASPEALKKFSQELYRRGHCHPEVLSKIYALPRQGHPMKLFCTALLLLGMIEGKEDYREDMKNVIAKVPELAAAVISHHAGWGPIKSSRPELGYIQNFVQMLPVPGANPQELVDIFSLFNILHYDHGGGNLSAFVGKAVASGLEDLFGSLTAAMTALAGPRHGRANQDCLAFVEAVQKEVGEEAGAEEVEQFIRDKLARNELVFGFGHAVLRVEDPRATVLYEVADKKFKDHPLVKMTRLLRQVGPKVLKENPKISNPYPNVDAISGTLLSAAGFPYPEYYTVLFGMARVVGISAQIEYERLVARNGKGTPIVRPKYFYKNLKL